jgi:hypothetical protein
MKAGRARFAQSRGVGADWGHHLGGDDGAAAGVGPAPRDEGILLRRGLHAGPPRAK